MVVDKLCLLELQALATFALKTKIHNDKGRSCLGDYLLQQEQDQLQQRRMELGINLSSIFGVFRSEVEKKSIAHPLLRLGDRQPLFIFKKY